MNSVPDTRSDGGPTVNYLTLTQAASVALCSTKTVRRAIKLGALEGFKCAGKWLIKPAGLFEWIERERGHNGASNADGGTCLEAVSNRRSQRPKTLDRVKRLRATT